MDIASQRNLRRAFRRGTFRRCFSDSHSLRSTAKVETSRFPRKERTCIAGLVVSFLPPVHAFERLRRQAEDLLALHPDADRGAIQVYHADAYQFDLSIDSNIAHHRRRGQAATGKCSRPIAAAAI